MNVTPPFWLTNVELLEKPLPDELLLELTLTFTELLFVLLAPPWVLVLTLTELWPLPSVVGTVSWTDPLSGTAMFLPLTVTWTWLELFEVPVVSAAEAAGVSVGLLELAGVSADVWRVKPWGFGLLVWLAALLVSATVAPANTNAPARV